MYLKDELIHIFTMCMRERKLRQRGGVSLHRRAPEKSKVYLDIVVVRKEYLENSLDAMQ